jgi:hypothetical protein
MYNISIMAINKDDFVHVASGEEVDQAFLAMATDRAVAAHSLEIGGQSALAFTFPEDNLTRNILERLNTFSASRSVVPSTSDETKHKIELSARKQYNRLSSGRWIHIIDCRYVGPLTPDSVPDSIPTGWIQY